MPKGQPTSGFEQGQRVALCSLGTGALASFCLLYFLLGDPQGQMAALPQDASAGYLREPTRDGAARPHSARNGSGARGAAQAASVLVGDGCPQTGQTLVTDVPSAGEAPGVACCSDEKNVDVLLQGGACRASQLGCKRASSLQEARATCIEAGLRLCSQFELELGACCSAGCGFESARVWSQTLSTHRFDGIWYSEDGQWSVNGAAVIHAGKLYGWFYAQEDGSIQLRLKGCLYHGRASGGRISWSLGLPMWSRQRPAEDGADAGGFYLLTSVLQSQAHKHTVELYKALARNLFNPVIHKVHVLVENNDGTKNVDWLRQRLRDAIPQTVKAATSADVGWALDKLVPSHSPRAPMYADFFQYANTALDGKAVMLANTDIVFDESLRLIDQRSLRNALGYLLSVSQPPAGAEYHEAFGEECSPVPRCTLGRWQGWSLGGASWDVYIFRPPMQNLDKHLNDLKFEMFHMGAENRAGWVLATKMGYRLTNPCLHVRAFHWHCQGEKMHNPDHTKSKIPWSFFHNLVPCWDCPGVQLPAGAAPLGELCMRGERVSVSGLLPRWHARQIPGLPDLRHENHPQYNWVGKMFRYPDNMVICCERGGGPDCVKVLKRLLENTPRTKKDVLADETSARGVLERAVRLCYSEYDVNCILSYAQSSYTEGNMDVEADP